MSVEDIRHQRHVRHRASFTRERCLCACIYTCTCINISYTYTHVSTRDSKPTSLRRRASSLQQHSILLYVYVHICVYVHIHAYVHIYVYVCIYYVHTQMWVHKYMYGRRRVNFLTALYLCVHVHFYTRGCHIIWMHLSTYIHLFIITCTGCTVRLFFGGAVCVCIYFHARVFLYICVCIIYMCAHTQMNTCMSALRDSSWAALYMCIHVCIHLMYVHTHDIHAPIQVHEHMYGPSCARV